VTRKEVDRLLREGSTLSEAATRLGVRKSTICYHARKLGIVPEKKYALRYDWASVQRYYDQGHSIRECAKYFGFSKETWGAAVRRGVLVSRPPAAPIETYLVKGRKVNRHHLKRRLLAAGLKEHRCESCGIREWLGKELPMSLHHVNGDGLDNRLANLQILCGNCHSQTPNFGSKKWKGRRDATRLALDARYRKLGMVSLGPTRRLPVIGTAS
jgi:transposase